MHRLFFLIAFACSAPFLHAQGTAADYERAGKITDILANKTFKATVAPHWISGDAGGDSAFWYRNALPEKNAEFIFVNAEKGTREPAFNHEKLAAALSKVAGGKFTAGKLPFSEIYFGKNFDAVYFRVAGSFWKWSRTEEILVNASPSEIHNFPEPAPRPSANGGAGVTVNFANSTNEEIRCLWVSPDNRRVPYATIKPGETISQDTYAGHVWIFENNAGKIIDLYEVAEAVPTFEIVKRESAKTEEPPVPEEPAKGANISPDGAWKAEIRDNNVWILATKPPTENAGESAFQLSSDGSPDNAYTNKFCWSPDSKKLAVMRVHAGDNRKIYMVESTPKDQLQPKLHTVNYPKPGDKIARPRPALFNVETHKKIEIPETLFPNPWASENFSWDKNSGEFFFYYNQRGHQIIRIVGVNAATGETRAVIEDTSKTFLDYSQKKFVRYLPETDEIVWMSERDGRNRLYLFDSAGGKLKNKILSGNEIVKRIEKVDTNTRQIWFYAVGVNAGEDPYHEHFCRVNFDGSGFVVLTKGDGTHTANFSPARRFFIDNYSRVDLPHINELRRADTGELICELEREDISALLTAGGKLPERFCAKGRDGKTDIYGIIIRPTNFDPAKKYPVIENIYAGPHDAHVPKKFSAFQYELRLAELGFIIVRIDGMGTNWREKSFHDVAWKNLADAGLPDRIAWIKAAGKMYPEMDTTRVGIYGGSAGGQNALGALLFHGDFYKAAVADCGCHDNRMDKIWWNEAWMGWPVDASYAENSNVTHAKNLRGKLLLIVGELDKNVDPASTMQVVDALIKADKDFDLLVIPGGGHCSGFGKYGLRRHQDFFVRALYGKEPRRLRASLATPASASELPEYPGEVRL